MFTSSDSILAIWTWVIPNIILLAAFGFLSSLFLDHSWRPADPNLTFCQV